MPSERPSYPGVTLTVVVWAVIAVGAVFFRPLIPAGRPSAPLERYSAKITWRNSVRDALREAMARNKPVALCLVNPSTSPAQTFEELTTRSRDVIETLERDFVPVRVNLLTDPALGGVFIPMDRANRNLVAGLQVVALRPDGSFAGTYLLEATDARVDELKVVTALESLRADTALRSEPAVAILDRQEADQLRFAPLEAPSAAQELTSPIADRVDQESFETAGIKVRPLDWLALLDQGEVGRVQSAFDTAMANHHFDWVGLKFLPERNSVDARQLSGRNSVALDADMATLLVRLAELTGDDHYRKLADLVAGSVERRLTVGDSGSWSPASPLGRPQRETWTADRLAQVSGLSAGLAGYWQLDPVKNPSLLPTPPDWRTGVDRYETWSADLAKMAAAPAPVKENVPDRVDWCAYAVARLLPLREDKAQLIAVAARLRKLQDPVWGAVHAAGMEKQTVRTPADAAAMALMLMSLYRQTGDLSVLQEGRKVLSLAEARFTDPGNRSSSGLGVTPPFTVPDAWLRPQVLDGLVQAPTTSLLEARSLYSLLDDSSSASAKQIGIRDEAARLASVVAPLGRHTGGVVGLALRLRENPPVVVCGPDAVARASGMKGVEALPVVEGVSGLSGMAPGVYRLSPYGLVPYSPGRGVPNRP